MTKFNAVQNSFKSGIISEPYFGRFDDDSYSGGAAEIENFIVGPEGGLIKRPGSEWVGQIDTADLTGNGDKGIRTPQLFEYFTEAERFIIAIDLEGGDADNLGGIIVSEDGTITAITQGAYLPDVSAYDEGYQAVQMGDTIYFTHPSGTVRPFIFTISTNPVFYFSGVTYNSYYTEVFLKPSNVTAITMTRTTVAAVIGPPAVAEYELLTASSAFFLAGHANTIMTFDISGTTYAAYVTEILSTTAAKVVEVLMGYGQTALGVGAGSGLPTDATATDDWRMEFWNGVDGYPRSITSHEQRVIYGGTPIYPDTLFCTQAGNTQFTSNIIASQDATTATSNVALFYGYYGAKTTDHAFTVQIAADRASNISWMDGANGLAVGTNTAEYIISSGTEGFGFDTISIKRQSSQGGAKIEAQKVGSATLFISENKDTLYSYFYFRDNGSYIARDMTHFFLPTSLTEGTSHNIRRCVFYRGTELYCLTYDETGRTAAISTVDFGGTLNSIVASGNYLYIAVTRTVDGSDVIYLEKMGADYAYPDLATGHPIFSDSAITYTSPGSVTLTGLDHLEDESVAVVADGNYKGLFTVVSGDITLDAKYTNIVVGLPFTAKIRTLPINYGGISGPSTGQNKRVHKLVALLYRSRNLKCGQKEAALDSISFDNTTTLYSGEKEIPARQSNDTRAQLYLVSDEPYPCYISSLVLQGVSYD